MFHPVLSASILVCCTLFGIRTQKVPDSFYVSCANEDCSAPISVAEATADYKPNKKNQDHLEFYKGEKILIYERFVTRPLNKFWVGEVEGLKPVVRAVFPKNYVKELEIYVDQEKTIWRKNTADLNTEPENDGSKTSESTKQDDSPNTPNNVDTSSTNQEAAQTTDSNEPQPNTLPETINSAKDANAEIEKGTETISAPEEHKMPQPLKEDNSYSQQPQVGKSGDAQEELVAGKMGDKTGPSIETVQQDGQQDLRPDDYQEKDVTPSGSPQMTGSVGNMHNDNGNTQQKEAYSEESKTELKFENAQALPERNDGKESTTKTEEGSPPLPAKEEEMSEEELQQLIEEQRKMDLAKDAASATLTDGAGAASNSMVVPTASVTGGTGDRMKDVNISPTPLQAEVRDDGIAVEPTPVLFRADNKPPEKAMASSGGAYEAIAEKQAVNEEQGGKLLANMENFMPERFGDGSATAKLDEPEAQTKPENKVLEQNLEKEVVQEKTLQQAEHQKLEQAVVLEKSEGILGEEKATRPVFKKVEENVIFEQKPQEHVATDNPEEKIVQEKPEEAVVLKNQEETVIQRKLDEDIAQEKPGETITQEKLEETVMQGKLDENVAPVKPEDAFVQRKLEDLAMQEKPKETVEQEKHGESIGQEKTEELITHEKISATVVKENFDKHSPENKSEEQVTLDQVAEKHKDAAQKQPNETLVKEENEEVVLQQEHIEKIADIEREKAVVDGKVDVKIDKNKPEDQATTETSEGFVAVEKREEPFVQKNPDEPLVQGKPEEPLVQGKPEEPHMQGKPDEPLVQGKPDEPLAERKPDEPLAEGKLDEPLMQVKPDEPIVQGKPDEPLMQGKPDEPFVQGKPEEPLLQGKPDEPFVQGKPEEPSIREKPGETFAEERSEQQVAEAKPKEEITDETPKHLDGHEPQAPKEDFAKVEDAEKRIEQASEAHVQNSVAQENASELVEEKFEERVAQENIPEPTEKSDDKDALEKPKDVQEIVQPEKAKKQVVPESFGAPSEAVMHNIPGKVEVLDTPSESIASTDESVQEKRNKEAEAVVEQPANKSEADAEGADAAATEEPETENQKFIDDAKARGEPLDGDVHPAETELVHQDAQTPDANQGTTDNDQVTSSNDQGAPDTSRGVTNTDQGVPDVDQHAPETNHLNPDTIEASRETQQVTQDTEHAIPDTNQVSQDTNHATPDTNQVTPDTNQVSQDTNQGTPDTNQVTPDTNQVTPDTNQVTQDTNQVTPDTHNITPDMNQVASNADSTENHYEGAEATGSHPETATDAPPPEDVLGGPSEPSQFSSGSPSYPNASEESYEELTDEPEAGPATEHEHWGEAKDSEGDDDIELADHEYNEEEEREEFDEQHQESVSESTYASEGWDRNHPDESLDAHVTFSPDGHQDAEYEGGFAPPPVHEYHEGVTQSPYDDEPIEEAEESTTSRQKEVRTAHESEYPRIMDPEGRPVAYEYASILEELEPGLDHQSWLLASMMPSLLQPMLAREPFGMAGCDLIKLAAAGLVLMITLMFYVSISICMQCAAGCSSASQAKKFAREALDKCTLAEAQVAEWQTKIKDLQNEAAIAQGEVKELQDKAGEAEEEKERLLEQLKENSTASALALQALQAQYDQTAGYLVEWEAYAKKQQELYESEALKNQHLTSEVEAAKVTASEAAKQLLDRSELSSSKVDEMQETIRGLESEIETLRTGLEEREGEREALLADKETIEERFSLIRDELGERTAEVESLRMEKKEADEALSLRNDELEILRGCVTEMTKSSNSALDSSDDDEQKRQDVISTLLDTARMKTELDELQRQYSASQHDLESEKAARSQTEESLKTIELRLDVLGSDLEVSRKETSDAQAALTHITKLYDAANVTIVRLNAAAEESGEKRDEDELRQQVSDLKAEVLQWRERGQQQEEEYKVSERDMRKRVIDGEKKAHQTWLAHRDAERKISSLKEELEMLRRSYSNLETDYQEGEASFRELQAQMERRERDDSSITSDRRPPSRSSIRSARYEDRRSESPFNGREEKPVDPLRAPPPMSTYSKKKKKTLNSSQRYNSQQQSLHETPPPHLTPSPQFMMSGPGELQQFQPPFQQPLVPQETPYFQQDPQQFLQMNSQFPQQTPSFQQQQEMHLQQQFAAPTGHILPQQQYGQQEQMQQLQQSQYPPT